MHATVGEKFWKFSAEDRYAELLVKSRASAFRVHRKLLLLEWLLLVAWTAYVWLSSGVTLDALRDREVGSPLRALGWALLGGGVFSGGVVLLSKQRGAKNWIHYVAGSAQVLWVFLLLRTVGSPPVLYFHLAASLLVLSFYLNSLVLWGGGCIAGAATIGFELLSPQIAQNTAPVATSVMALLMWLICLLALLNVASKRTQRRLYALARSEAELQRLKTQTRVKLEARQNELRESDSKCRVLVESTSAIPWEMEADTGIWTYVSPQIEGLLGYPQTLWYEKHFHARHVHPIDLEEFISECNEAISADKPRELEYRLLAKDGRSVAVRNVLTPAVSKDGRRLLRGLIFDITEKRKLESELAQAQKLEAVGRLAAGIAHEINTPVQFVGDSLSFLNEGTEDVREALRRMCALGEGLGGGTLEAKQAAKEIQNIVEELDLDYLLEHIPNAVNRAVSGLERVATIVRAMKEFAYPDIDEKVDANLNECITNTLAIASSEYKYVATVHTELGDIPSIKCHVGRINQVILNLVVNAAHAIADVVSGTSNKGTISIKTRREGPGVSIEISDTGVGIAQEIREKVFDPFFTTKAPGRGTGQGLSIARNVIVEKHDGRINFESEVGKGTTFSIWLPIASDESRATATAQEGVST